MAGVADRRPPPHRQLMHSSNFSSSNGSTEDLFRDSIDSCDNDITEKVSFLEKKVTELENDSLASGGLKSKLKLENVQLVHRSGQGARGAQRSHCQGRSPGLSDPAPLGLDCRPDRYSWMHSPRACDSH